MKLFADNCVERALVLALRAKGHDVSYAKEMGADPGDDILLAKAAHESRTLLTADLDFGELVVRDYEFNSGVILMRLDPLKLKSKIQRVCDVLDALSQPPPGVIFVIEPGRTRTRRTP